MNSVSNIIVKHQHGLVTDCHHLPMVPIVPQSVPMASVADVSVTLYITSTIPRPTRYCFRHRALAETKHGVSKYESGLCCPTPGTRGCSSLRSLEQRLLFVPFARTSTTQVRAFSVVGSVWNGLPLAQRLLPMIFLTHFTLASKLFLLAVQGSGAITIEGRGTCRKPRH